MPKKSPQPAPVHVLSHKIAVNPHRNPHCKLGRHIEHDPRSRDFPAKKATKIVSVMHDASKLLPLNQGQVGSCTANAALAAIECAPYLGKVTLPVPLADARAAEKFAVELYHDETLLHPKDGIYPPNDPGGSGLAIAKVLKNRGLISGYSHAFGLDHALKALVLAPVILGVDWYSSFDTVNIKTGLVEIGPNAKVEGGHEICAFGIDVAAKLVWFWQSWGKWGKAGTGQFCMSFDTVDALLKNQGDCTQFAV
jgi:hypothetical protein